MGLFDFLKKKSYTDEKTGRVKKTAGVCCLCGRKLFRNPHEADRLDNAARYCRECGTDICVDCLRKQVGGASQYVCPACGKKAFFEINPLFRP